MTGGLIRSAKDASTGIVGYQSIMCYRVAMRPSDSVRSATSILQRAQLEATARCSAPLTFTQVLFCEGWLPKEKLFGVFT